MLSMCSLQLLVMFFIFIFDSKIICQDKIIINEDVAFKGDFKDFLNKKAVLKKIIQVI